MTSGRYVAAWGDAAVGSAAAAYYFTNAVAPAIRTVDARWFLVDWTDRDGDQAPSAADTFDLIGSGA